jgi:hypothetical protein
MTPAETLWTISFPCRFDEDGRLAEEIAAAAEWMAAHGGKEMRRRKNTRRERKWRQKRRIK